MQESLLGVTLQPPAAQGIVLAAINPPKSGLASARGSVPSIAGPIAVAWSWTRGRTTLALQVTVPTNATARITVPAHGVAAVREGGVALGHAPGVIVDSADDGMVVLNVGGGSYRFTAKRS
jgi:alpha-L-rhamnosidase